MKIKKHPEQRAMIAEPRGRERDELAQRPKRDAEEQDHHRDAAEGVVQQSQHHPHAEDDRHEQPGADPRVEHADHRRVHRRVGLAAQNLAARGRQRQHHDVEKSRIVVGRFSHGGAWAKSKPAAAPIAVSCNIVRPLPRSYRVL